MHTAAVGGNKMSAAERTFAGLTDEQMRVRPREDLNSIAWLVWHIARAEDILVGQVVAGGAQLFDEGWKKRLGVTRPDFGIGMTSPEVSELTRQSGPPPRAPSGRGPRRSPRASRAGRAPGC